MAGVSLRGLVALQRAMGSVAKRYQNAADGALYLEASRIMAKSVPLVPVDTGRLRASQFVSSPTQKAGGRVVVLGYGTKYAAAVHERQDIRHKVGSAKFLRRAFDEERSSAAKNIAADTKRLFRDGQGFGDIRHQFPTKPKA